MTDNQILFSSSCGGGQNIIHVVRIWSHKRAGSFGMNHEQHYFAYPRDMCTQLESPQLEGKEKKGKQKKGKERKRKEKERNRKERKGKKRNGKEKVKERIRKGKGRKGKKKKANSKITHSVKESFEETDTHDASLAAKQHVSK